MATASGYPSSSNDSLHDGSLPWTAADMCRFLEKHPDVADGCKKIMQDFNAKFRTAHNLEMPPFDSIDRRPEHDGSDDSNGRSGKRQKSEKVEVNICSYNILAQGIYERRCEKRGEDVPPKMKWDQRSCRLLSSMKKSPKECIMPDIMALQEVEKASFATLVEDGYHGVFLSKFPPEKKREGCAVIVNAKVWNIVDREGLCFCLPDFSECIGESPTDGAWPQKALIVTLQHVIEQDVRIVVAVSHLGAGPRANPVGDFLRTGELVSMHERAREVADGCGGAPYFLCLDQNANRSEMPFRYAAQEGLESVKQPSPTHNMGLDPEPSMESLQEHDFIYFNRARLAMEKTEDVVADCGSIELTIPTCEDGASDHVPVFGSFRISVGAP